MPKRKHTISQFRTGLRHNISKEDLPDDALVGETNGVNIDSSGTLKGFSKSTPYPLSINPSNVVYAKSLLQEGNNKQISVERRSSEYYLKHHDEKKPDESEVDVDEISIGNLDSVNDGQVSIQQYSSHMYIGTGNNENTVPKWAGVHRHDQFGVPSTGEIKIEDAECKPVIPLDDETSFPLFDNSAVFEVSGHTYLIAIRSNYSRAYLFKDGVPIARSDQIFINPTAIWASGDRYIIFDSGNHRIYQKQFFQVDELDWLKDLLSASISGMPFDSRYIIRDIHRSSSDLYILRVKAGSQNTPLANSLYTGFPNWGQNGTVDLENITYRTLGEIQIRDDFFPGDTQPQLSDWVFRAPKKAFYRHTNSDVLLMLSLYKEYTVATDEEGSNKEIVDELKIRLSGQGSSIVWGGNDGDAGNAIIFFISPTLNKAGVRSLGTGIKDLSAVEAITSRMDNGTAIATIYRKHSNAIQTTVYTVPGFSRNVINLLNSPATINGFDNQNIFGFSGEQNSIGQFHFVSSSGNGASGTQSGTTVNVVSVSRNIISVAPVETGFTESNLNYSYGISYIYDGYQESPLSAIGTGVNTSSGMGFRITIKIPQSDISRRITGINIYRAESQAQQVTPHRLVTYFDIKDTVPTETIDGEVYRVIEYNDEKRIHQLGPGYEANAGIPEAMSKNIVHYACSCISSDMLIVGNIYHPDIDDGEFMVAKSSSGMFSVFNYETNIVRLPFIPISLVDFRGRVYAFGDNACAVINPFNMLIERVIDGFSTLNQYTALAVDDGIISLGHNSVNYSDGSTFQSVSAPIESYAGKDNAGIVPFPEIINKADKAHLLYDYHRKKIYVFFTVNNHSYTANEYKDFENLVMANGGFIVPNNSADLFFGEDVSVNCPMNAGNKDKLYFGTQNNNGKITYVFCYDKMQQSWSCDTLGMIGFNFASTSFNKSIAYYSDAMLIHLYGNQDLHDSFLSKWVSEHRPFHFGIENVKKWFYDLYTESIGSSIPEIYISFDDKEYIKAISEVVETSDGSNPKKIVKHSLFHKGESIFEFYTMNIRILGKGSDSSCKIKSYRITFRPRIAIT